MTILQILTVGLILIAVGIGGYTAVKNWRTHHEWQQEATRRGWRYTTVGWHQIRKPNYRVAGTTRNNTVWELNRYWRKGKLYFSWQANTTELLYGILVIVPEGGRLPVNSPQLKKKNMSAILPEWPDTYLVYTTHDQLAVRFFSKPIATLLRQYPKWPQNGSLEKLIWKPNEIHIVCLYENGWAAMDKTVALGTMLMQINSVTPKLEPSVTSKLYGHKN